MVRRMSLLVGLISLCISMTVLVTVGTDGPAKPKYIGSKKCKLCHVKLYKSWEATKMAKSFDILKAGSHAEAKKKFNLDPEKDYTKDPKCVKCHVVGFGEPGGYHIPANEEEEAAMEKLKGTGCESCHGPGELYNPVMKEIKKAKEYTDADVEKMKKLGLIPKPTKETCEKCHNEESPSVNKGDPFDFEKKKSEGTHAHEPLKYKK